MGINIKIKAKLALAAIALVIIPMSLATILPSLILGREKQKALGDRLSSGLSEANKIIESTYKNHDLAATALSVDDNIRSHVYVLHKYGARLDHDISAGFEMQIKKHLTHEHLTLAMKEGARVFIAVYDTKGTLLASVVSPEFDIDITSQPQVGDSYFSYAKDELLLIAHRPIKKDDQNIGSVFLGEAIDARFVNNLSDITDLTITLYLDNGTVLGPFRKGLILPGDARATKRVQVLGQRHIDNDTFFLASSREDFGQMIAGVSISDIIKATRTTTFILIAIALFSTLIAIVIIFIWTEKSVVSPIHELTKGARKVGEGNLNVTFNIRTRDEINELGNAFNEMTSNLKNHIKQLSEVTAAKERMQSELRIAHDIQMSIIPKIFPPFPNRPEFDIYAVLEPTKEVGGDLYDFFFIDDDHLCFVIGDVSGKGVPASLFMAVVKTMIKATAKESKDPSEILHKINKEISHDNPSCMFATIFCCILNIKTGEVHYANGGHNPPLIIRSGKEPEFLKTSVGMVVGTFEEAEFGKGKVTLGPGDIFYMYTDGVTEAANKKNELFSEERLQKKLSVYKEAHVQELIEATQREISAFCKGAPQSDDITIMALEYFSTSSKRKISKIRYKVIILKNDLSETTRLMAEVTQFGKAHNLPDSIIGDSKLALEEIVTNIISYGYESKGGHKINVTLELKDTELIIKVEDDSRPFNPLETPKPDLEKPLEEMQVGGLGIHLVRRVMDKIEYKRQGDKNLLVMFKKIL